MATVRSIETIRGPAWPNILWVIVRDSDGARGSGETYYVPAAVEAVIHDMAAPLLLGCDAGDIEGNWQTLFSAANFHGFAGAESRATSALDIALWDLAARRAEISLSRMLGGRVRERIRTYNTCVDAGPHLDAQAWVSGDAGKLATELLAGGITGMKVWPWDRYAPQLSGGVTGPAGWSAMGPVGHDLPEAQLQEGLGVIAAIRDAVGSAMDIMVEGHGRWDLPTALRICGALQPYRIRWAEDLMQQDSVEDLRRLALEGGVPLAVSERLFTRYAYRNVFERGAAQIAMFDIAWTGGVTEARKIAALADTYHLPVAPHDCTGPLSLAASLQLCGQAPNATIMETVRGFLDGWYADVLEERFEVHQGWIEIPDSPGLGMTLRGDLADEPGAIVRRSTLG